MGTTRPPNTLSALLTARASASPHRPALVRATGETISYAELDDTTTRLAQRLHGSRVASRDVVAIAVSRGVPAAIGFLAAARVGTAAPLNPSSAGAELRFTLDDMQARVMLVDANTPKGALRAAADLGIETIALDAQATPVDLPESSEDDVALLLHTSGTTARPKSVPLRHRNLLASAGSIATTLSLTETDRCLNIMPLFHIHGLVGCLLSTLYSGGSIVCTEGFLAPEVLRWLSTGRPTWYSAVPTMHQGIADRARSAAEQGITIDHNLRFARSSSSALPPSVSAAIESLFGIPVVEAYGMTEASHQMTSNRLPPGERYPGTVGFEAGASVAVLDANGGRLPEGTIGEIVVRGDGVFDGYRDNDEATDAAFVDGWFRTGDLGYLRQGVLTIEGRSKEIINRGGEKISPRQIDEVLLEHPSVSQAMAFAVPDQRLGERVAAACVLTPQSAATELALRLHVESALDAHKVPERIVFVEDLPKGPTGKPQRIGAAERLGVSLDEATRPPTESVQPSTETEQFVLDQWSEILGTRPSSVTDRFLDVGGDSMLAARLIARLQTMLGVEFSLIEFFDRATIVDQASYIDDLLADRPAQR